MSAQTQRRRLVLLRHAKSAWPHGVPDHDRPLAGKGRRNAQAVGQWFRREGPRLDLVLCSDALRALQTWEIVAETLPGAPEASVRSEIYGASAAELLDLLAQIPADVRTVLVVGHEPTMSQTVLRLADAGSDPAALIQIRDKYPTNGIAVLEHEGPWPQWGDSGASVVSFVVPRSGE